MVGVAGFEPATPASRTRCSTRLSHTPTWRRAYRGASAAPQAVQKVVCSGALHPSVRCAISAAPGRAGVPATVPAGEWCNGNTAVFGTVILGSSPSSPATEVLCEIPHRRPVRETTPVRWWRRSARVRLCLRGWNDWIPPSGVIEAAGACLRGCGWRANRRARRRRRALSAGLRG